MSEPKFKVGDLLLHPKRGFTGRVLEVITETQYRLQAAGCSPESWWEECNLEPAPEPEITDAERIAAIQHPMLDRLYRNEHGMRLWYVSYQNGNDPCGYVGGERTQAKALDAWVRHLRSTGWKFEGK